MKAKVTTASAAIAALAVAYWKRHLHRSRESRFEGKCQRQAIETFEGEGGLVLT
jgi:hypothetical protein